MALPNLEDCKPGFAPLEFNVIIAAEESEEVTKGGIILVADSKEKKDMASMVGLLVANSPLAYTYAEWPDGTRLPQVGDKVLFSKYAGILIDGEDGRKFRVVKDKDIMGVYQ